MDLNRQIFRGISWLAFFKACSQIFSWTITIIVARILTPADYGLMAMATIITGYAMMFSQLGLGSAIIQKEKIITNELSSVFWFLFTLSIFFAVFCLLVAYPTAWIFDEPRLVPLTQTISLIFLLSGVQIVPLSLLKKQLAFKKVGFAEMISIFISSLSMYIFAKLGFGVWTLIGGSIVHSISKLILVYSFCSWRPRLHFRFLEIKDYFKFGVFVALTESLFYTYSRSDKFFAGRIWDTSTLGLYTFAQNLASLPTRKIVVLINQVSFSAFSKLQNNDSKFKEAYLLVVKVTAIFTMPLFVGGYLVGEDLIYILLDDKWHRMTFIFRMLCLVQILTAINAVNNFVHTAKGRPQLSLYNNAVLCLIMPLSFFISVKYGLNAILIPWFSSYLIISVSWMIYTLRSININLNRYSQALLPAFFSTIMMSIAITGYTYIDVGISHVLFNLLLKILIGGITYIVSILLFDRSLSTKISSQLFDKKQKASMRQG